MLLKFDAPKFVISRLNDLGRTEDICLSPDNKKIALVGYQKNKLLILNIDKINALPAKKIYIKDCIEVLSTSFKNPHGVAWINNEVIVVANRLGGAFLLKIPPNKEDVINNQIWLTPIRILPKVSIKENLSIDCVEVNIISTNLCEILLCSNNGNYISSHLINLAENYDLESSSILLKKNIDVPDGVAISNCKRWIAVSNHDDNSIFVYRNQKSLTPFSPPEAILNGTKFPHGIKFIGDSHYLFVSDAGSPFVNLYYSESGEWSGNHSPIISFRVLDEEAFQKGHVNPQEGGVKGIDVVKESFIIVTTCQEQKLAFFDLSKAIDDAGIKNTIKQLKPTAMSLDDYFYRATKTMLLTQRLIIDESSTMLAYYRTELERVIASKSWKVTFPLRVINKKIKKIKCFLLKF